MIEGKWGRNAHVVLVVVLLLSTALPTALGASEVESPRSGPRAVEASAEPAFGVGDLRRRGTPSENNTTVLHRNPDAVSGDDDLSGVRVWLSREMSGRLAESINVSQSDRQRAQELIGNDSQYSELVEQYAEVSEQLQSGDSANRSNQFVVVGALQRKFLADVAQYWTTYRTYQRARDANQTRRTRRLAHELERRADDVERAATRLNESLANVTSMERAELRNATRTIGATRANVTDTQLTVRAQTFERTRLSVRAVTQNGSFIDPVTLVGRLRTTEGSPLADENVTLHVGNRTLRIATDDRGRFEVAYRPVLAPTGERSRVVEFRPANDSVYLGTNATATFGVRRVTPTVRISNSAAAVGYNRSVVVNGTTMAGDVGVPDVPVVVSVDGVRVARVRTGSNGSFGTTARLPANVSTGSQQLRVRLALSNATRRVGGPVAIASAAASTTLTVESTDTSLSITDVQTFNESAFVTGRLTTEDGDPIANRTVEVRVNGTTVGTVRTNGTGSYATTVSVPRGKLGRNSALGVVATFSPSGGNLDSSRASTVVTVSSSSPWRSTPLVWFGVAGLVGVATLGVAVWRFRAGDEPSPDPGVFPETPEPTAHDEESTAGTDRSGEALLDAARAALDSGASDVAVVVGYAAARRWLEATLDSETPRTHWEFYAASRDSDVPDDDLRRLEQLTAIYERSAFAAESVSTADATEAVELAESFRPSDAGADSEGTEDPASNEGSGDHAGV